MTKRVIFEGQIYGELTVVKSLGKSTGTTKYECKCSCGKVVGVRGRNLTIGKTKSCGCKTSEYKKVASTKHGLYDLRVYRIWRGMMARCENLEHKHYKYYGGKGIKVCDEWRDLNRFYKYWGEIEPPLTIERFDSEGDYEPANCKLATPKEQANNRSSNCILEYKGKKMTIVQWADYLGVKPATIQARKYRGLPLDRILSRKVVKAKRIEYKGEIVNMAKLSKQTGITYSTLASRYARGLRGDKLLQGNN